VILVSHDLTLVKEYADSVILLDRTVLKEGTPEEVMESPEFHEIFG
jgi:zinc transport system ATP-binding protein